MNDKIDYAQIAEHVKVIRGHLELLVQIDGINNGENNSKHNSYVSELDDGYKMICEASNVQYEPITANRGRKK